MAQYRGMDGSMTFSAGVVGEIKSWSVNASQDVHETTAMQVKWKTKLGGLADWRGQATFNLDYGDAGQAAIINKLLNATPASTPTALELIVSNTGPKKFTGSALVNGIQFAGSVGDIFSFTCSLEGSGPLLPSWV